jgi:hypothetical protein
MLRSSKWRTSGFPTTTLYVSLPLPTKWHISLPFQQSFNHPNVIFKESWNSSPCSFLQPPVISSFLCQNTVFNSLLSNSLSFCSSLDEVMMMTVMMWTECHICSSCNNIFRKEKKMK